MKMIHSRKEAYKYLFRFLFFAILISISYYLLGKILNLSQTFFFTLGMIIGIGTFYILEHKLIHLIWKFHGNMQGAVGEEDVAKFLKEKLVGNHIIANNVEKLLGFRGDVDHIIIGENSIFVIETKTHKGIITCNGDEWQQKKKSGRKINLYQMSPSPSKQIRRNSVNLKKFLKENYPKLSDVYINNIIIFPNKDEEKIIIKKEPNNCKVMTSLNDLIKFIYKKNIINDFSDKNKNLKITKKDISNLKDIFSKYTSNIDIIE